MLKKIEINIHFLEALTQMPQYAKFMKDILSKNRKITKEGSKNKNRKITQMPQLWFQRREDSQ